MASTSTPHMNLTSPRIGTEIGPIWAFELNSNFLTVDRHNHVPGLGEPVPIAGLLINVDWPLNENNITTVRTARFSPQPSSFTPGTADVGCLYVEGIDLYYRDGSNQIVRITASHSLNVTSTGVFSGTANASFSSAQLVVTSSPSVLTSIEGASLILGNAVVGTHLLTLTPPNPILAPGYNLYLPPPVVGSSAFLTLDTVGNITGSYSTLGGILGSNIAPGTITSATIVPGTLTGSQVSPNSNLPGTTTIINGAFPVASTTSIGTRTELQFGRCDGENLVINGGVAYFSHVNGSGRYDFQLSDSASPSWLPTVVAMIDTSDASVTYYIRVLITGASTFTIYTQGSAWHSSPGVFEGYPVDAPFSFMAIGAIPT